MNKFDIYIEEEGDVVYVYDDALVGVQTEGTAIVRRVSHVEPHPHGGWTADMRPVGGPVLYKEGTVPFATRAEALAAERAWLEARMQERRL